MACSTVAPSLQHHLLAVQAGGGRGLREALEAALDACSVTAGGGTAALRRLLLGRGTAPAILVAAANASGHPCAPGILLARVLSGSLVGASELLAAADPAELAAAVAALHAAAAGGALPAPATSAAQAAFATLIKALATSGDAAEQQREADRVMVHLRHAWLAPDAAAGSTHQRSGGTGPLLLAAVVDAVDAQVFPRHLAHSWLTSELGHALRAPGAGDPQLQQPQQQAAARGHASPGSGWAAAMAAFAAALPVDTVLQQAQAAAWEGSLHPQRAAALLVAAAQQQPSAGQQVERWASAQVAAALAQHAAAPLLAVLLLQRERLLWRSNEPGGAGAVAAQQGAQQQQQQQQQQQSAHQAYKQWFAATLVAPDQHPHLQFLVQQVLIPLVPEESAGCGWLQAQADVLAGLLRLAAQPGAAPLPQAAARAAEEYLEAAKQRLKAEQAVAAAAGGGQAAAGGPAAPLTNLQKGQVLVAAMLREYEDNGGELRTGTLNQMQAKASNVFTRGEIHNMLLPALLAPTDDEVDAQRRAALMQYLFQELGRRGDTQVRPHLKPEAVALFQRRCLQAQLENATLQQLVERAPQLLKAGDAGLEEAGGGVSSHQVLDKLGRLVGEQLQQWQGQQQQQQQQHGHQQQQERPRPGSGRQHTAAQASPDELACVLLDVWTAAYCSSSRCAPSSSSGPSPTAVAAHLLSVAHAHPALHSPLLCRLRQRLLGSRTGHPAAAAQHARQHEMEAAVMLATVAGALVQQRGASGVGGTAGSPDGLQPLYVWQQQGYDVATAAEEAAAAASAGPASVPGPLWLQQLLMALPLSGADAMARSAGVAAAHLSCLRYFRQHCLLPGGGGSHSSRTVALALHWQTAAAASAGGYDGELVTRLVFPACTAALRLLQWLLLRLSAGSQLLPSSRGRGSSSSGAGWGDVGRATKRQRSAAGTAAGAAPDCDEVLGLCSKALRMEPGASLAATAGGLPLADYLRQEAAARCGGSVDLLPPGAGEAALRLCCALYLQPGSDVSELGSLIQPLTAVPAGGDSRAAGGGAAGAYVDDAGVLTVPDSEEEDAPEAGAGATASDGSETSAVCALGAAAASVLADAAQQGVPATAAALSVCQQGCGQSLRLLAATLGSAGMPSLLAQLLAAMVQHSRQQLVMHAVAPAGQPEVGGQRRQAAVQLRPTDPQQACAVQQAVAALASGLTLELLPLPLVGSGTVQAQPQRRAAVADTVDWALSDAGLGVPTTHVQQQLAAALEGV